MLIQNGEGSQIRRGSNLHSGRGYRSRGRADIWVRVKKLITREGLGAGPTAEVRRKFENVAREARRRRRFKKKGRVFVFEQETKRP